MTPLQRRVLDFICAYRSEHGYSPIFAEIARHIGIRSTSGVHRVVSTMIRDGLVVQWPGPRGIEPIQKVAPRMHPGDIGLAEAVELAESGKGGP